VRATVGFDVGRGTDPLDAIDAHHPAYVVASDVDGVRGWLER